MTPDGKNRCLKAEQICDNVPDCPQGEDELPTNCFFHRPVRKESVMNARINFPHALVQMVARLNDLMHAINRVADSLTKPIYLVERSDDNGRENRPPNQAAESSSSFSNLNDQQRRMRIEHIFSPQLQDDIDRENDRSVGASDDFRGEASTAGKVAAERIGQAIARMQRQLEEQQLEERQLEERQLEEQQLEEQQLSEQQLEEQQLEEQQLEEQQLEEQQLEEQQLSEQQLEEKGRQQAPWRRDQHQLRTATSSMPSESRPELSTMATKPASQAEQTVQEFAWRQPPFTG